MQKVHTDKWFEKQEARLQEPIKNTKRYYYKREWIKIATVILAPWGIRDLWRMYKCLKSYFEFYNECLSKGRTITNDGPPGAGKTFTGSNMACFLAERQFSKLRSDYLTQRTMVAAWVKNGEADKISSFKALEESYLFYSEHADKYIPCLVSSVPLKEYGTGRMSYKLTPEIFLQIDRSPEYTVFFNDESGYGQGADKSKTKNADVLAYWRLHRHFIDGIVVNTNQDGNQNAIFIRRSTDYVNHISGQEWLFEPVRLKKKIARLEKRYFKRLSKGLDNERTEYIGQELYYLKKYAATIGFRRITHRMTTTEGQPVGDEGIYIFPAIGGVQYDDRAYRNLYKCKDKKISLKGWDKLVIDEYDQSAFNNLENDEANAESGAA